jgi:MFS family permease
VIFGVLIMFGIGGASSPTSAVAVARWFTARRGLALGVVAAGSAAGQFVLVPVMAALVSVIVSSTPTSSHTRRTTTSRP